MEFVDLKKQYQLLKNEIDRQIKKVLEHGQYINGPEIEILEETLSNYLGSKGCVATSSGTDALLIALMTLGIKPGDEVITTPFSFISTAETILLLGATPVFVDINPKTYNLDPKLIDDSITAKTKAIMPVSLYGQMADLESINTVAKQHGLAVIEDGAQSFGATSRGKRSCSVSTIGCTSFFPSKPLGCYGDGGACFSNDVKLIEKMREIRNHGQKSRYHHAEIGINGRLDTLQAAILLAKFAEFQGEIRKRSAIGESYTREIIKINKGVFTPEILAENTSVFAQYTIELDNRDGVAEELRRKGIPTTCHYPTPLHMQPAIQNHIKTAKRFPVAESASKRVLSLPMHPYLDQSDIEEVVSKLSSTLKNIV